MSLKFVYRPFNFVYELSKFQVDLQKQILINLKSHSQVQYCKWNPNWNKLKLCEKYVAIKVYVIENRFPGEPIGERLITLDLGREKVSMGIFSVKFTSYHSSCWSEVI